MFSKGELLTAIEELERAPATYQNAEKLATFYLLYDHLFSITEPVQRIEPTEEVIIADYGTSEFLQAITGKQAEATWLVIDELLNAVNVLQPRLYRATLDKIKT